MNTIYHVAPADHTGDLLSLYTQHGDEAYEIFDKRWPDGDNALAQYHVHCVHCWSNLADAQKHLRDFGGKLYAVNAQAMVDDGWQITIDNLEFAHPVVRDEIPEEYLAEI